MRNSIFLLGLLAFAGCSKSPSRMTNDELEKAAAHGNAEAQFRLGTLYWEGRGVAKDELKGNEWYAKAAAGGNADAQYEVGNLFESTDDAARAVEWYQKAAAQRNAHAQVRLGWMYEIGKGVPKDEIQAYAWINLAAAQTDDDARKLLDHLEERMTADQKAEALKLSAKLLKKSPKK